MQLLRTKHIKILLSGWLVCQPIGTEDLELNPGWIVVVVSVLGQNKDSSVQRDISLAKSTFLHSLRIIFI